MVVECDEIELRVGGCVKLIKMVVNLVLMGFMVLKVFWLWNYELRKFDCIKKVLLFKDDVCCWFMGEYVIDVSDVSGMFLFDVVKCIWLW